MTRLSTDPDAVRLQALLSRLDHPATGACPVQGCVHAGGGAPRDAGPPRRPEPALRAA